MDELAVDASVLCAFFLNEETGADVVGLIEANARFYCPPFWRFEAANAVWKRKAIPLEVAEGIIEKIWSFTVYGEDSDGWVKEAFLISRKNNITFYDSSYIALAKFFAVPLWTLDKAQSEAARRSGVLLFENE